MSNLLTKAYYFAGLHHHGQIRKYTGEPYLVHPVRVALLFKTSVPAHEEDLAAALLHDVVEDTPVTEADLRREFSDAIADKVEWLTGQRGPALTVNTQHVPHTIAK